MRERPWAYEPIPKGFILKLKLIQSATFVGTVWIAWLLTHWWLPDLIHLGVCTYVIGPC